MKPILYHHPTCSTCKKALAYLRQRGVDVDAREIAKAPPRAEELLGAIERSGLPARRFFNTSGRSYREGGWSDRVASLSNAEAAEALAADGMLIKRPLVLAGDAVLVGFREAEWDAAFPT